MAHRGRLNVLANILRKPFEEIFNEFEDNYLPHSTHDGDGDVKYHLGFSADVRHRRRRQASTCRSRPTRATWRSSNPVVEGRVRAKQRLHGDADRTTGVPVLIHGDAAFAGQGVVMETFNLMNLAGYRTGGTIHVVVNNQIGFTTNPRDARSTQYCTDIAKFIQAPIFHVNAEDPEACVASPSWPWSSASSSSATWSSTWCATASGGTTRATSRRSPSRSSRRSSRRSRRSRTVYAARLAEAAGDRA